VTWLTWRQHRGQLLVTAGFLAVLGTVLLAHSIIMTDQLAGLASDEAGRLGRLASLWGQAEVVLPWLAVVPAMIGLFWGAPLLSREYEQGTYRLAWTQSRTRRAWLLIKLGELGGAVVLAGLAFGVMLNAWAAAFAPAADSGRLRVQSLFAVTGVVPAAWWLFAFVLGTTAGALVRRLLSAMVVTLAVFLAAYGSVFAFDVRESYATPERVELTAPVAAGDPWAINTPGGVGWNTPPGAMVVDHGWVDRTGQTLVGNEVWACGESTDYLGCMREAGNRWFAEFHSADQYWRFQWTEAGILLVATTLLGCALAYRVARRGASA
jgi:hypothetical protein